MALHEKTFLTFFEHGTTKCLQFNLFIVVSVLITVNL